MNSIVNDLHQKFPGAVFSNIPLNHFSRWKVGGLADVIIYPRNIKELSSIRAWIHHRDLPSLIIGATSNLLFSDKGLHAIAICIDSRFSSFLIQNETITADPGIWVPFLARKAMQSSLSGIEHTCGIPGTLGGLVCMNGGSQRKGIGKNITKIQSVNARGDIIERNNAECKFAYRTSIFQSNNEVIAKIFLELEKKSEKSSIRSNMLNILRDRRSKFPQKIPNCGSVFVSNPAMYADYGPPGKIIETLGLKGHRIGGAQISPMHANFIINDVSSGNRASTSDIIELINLVRGTVEINTGYRMDVEVRNVLEDGSIVTI